MKIITQSTANFSRNSFSKFVAFSSFLVFCLMSSFSFGQAASAAWAGTLDSTAANSGNVTGANQAFGTANTSTGFSTTNGFQSTGWPTTAYTTSQTTYYQFAINPTTGNNLSVTSISLQPSISGPGSAIWAVYYSTSPSFTSPVQIGTNTTVNSTTPTTTTFSSLSIPVNSGNTIYLRFVAGTADATGRNIRLRNFVISGTTAAAAPTYTSTVSGGDWNTAATWSVSTGGTGVPTAGSIVVVNTNVTAAATPTNQPSSIIVNSGFNLTLNGAYTNPSGSAVTVNSGGTLAVGASYTNTGSTTVNGTFQINQGGFGGGAGTWTYGSSSTLIFNHTSGNYGPIDSFHTYWPVSGPTNVTVANLSSGGINLGVTRTVSGIFQTAANIQGNALSLNGIVRINTGGSVTSSPNYGAASTLVYNTGAAFGRGNEWTSATSGAGYPANVQISNPGTVTTLNMGTTSAQCSGNITVDASTILNTTSAGLTVLGSITTNGTTATGGAMNVTGTVTTNGTISLGGDVTLSGSSASNWVVGSTATQNNNGKAVFFTGTSGTQTVTKTGTGSVIFDYLVINKAAGSVQLSATPATTVTINTTAGDVLQILNAGALDLNGQTLTLNNAGGTIAANAAGRSITSTTAGAILAIAGAKAFNGAGALVINTNVTTVLTAGFDFGVSKVTVNGTLQLNGGGFASNGSAPTYASGSTLLFNTGGFYDVHNGTADVAGWFRNVASTGSAQAGVPWNVTISNNTSVRYNSANNDVFPRYINGNLIINTGSAFTLGGISGTAGDFFLRGNWTNSGTFTANSRLVSFNGTSAQTITGATIFDYLTINNTAGVTLANSITNNFTLDFTNGKLTLGTNDLNIGSGGTITNATTAKYIVTNSSGQLKRTVSGSDALFAVGNTAYNPITFNNAGGTPDVYGVRVSNTTPAGANPTKTITRQWITTEAVAGGSNLAVTAQYNTGETGAGFAAGTNTFIGHYNGTAYTQQIAATLAGSNPFTAASNALLYLTPADLTTGTQYFAIGKDNGLFSVATQYVVTAITPASPGQGYPFSVTVQAQDAFGVATNVTAASTFTLSTNGNAGAIGGTTSGTIASGTNSIIVSGVTLPNAGTGVTITATNSAGLSLTAGTSTSFIVQAKASKLAFGTAPPATGNVGANLTSFTVRAERPDNTLDAFYTGTITISKASGSGILSGTLTATAVAGIATFNAAQFDTADTYTIIAAATGLTQVTSGNIVVTLAPVTLGTYTFTGTASSSGPAARLLVSSVASNVSFSSYGRNTLTINAASGSDDNVFSVQPSAGTYGTVINTALYEEFTVTANVGYYLNLGSITFSIGRTGAGAQNYIVRSNQDNYTADISTGTIPTTAASRTVPLSGSSNNAITYRIYLYGGGSTGFVRIDDVTFNGNAICLQPTVYAVTGGGVICVGSAGTLVGLSNSQLGINYQLKVGASNVGSPVAGTGTALNFGNQNTVGTYTVVATNTNGTCNLSATMTGSVNIAAGATTTWTGSSWDNGAPTSLSTAIIAANYSELQDITACTLTVNNSAVVLIPTGKDVILNGALTVTSPATFTLSNTANLVQLTNATNSGNIIVNRNSSSLKRLDYTLWSSPVTGQGLYAFSKFTLPNRFYVYNTGTDLYSNSVGFSLTNLQFPAPLVNDVNQIGVDGTDTSNGGLGVQFTAGKGYLIRVPYNHPTTPAVYNGVFTGVANNGDISPTVSTSLNGYNAVGNPYPSRLSVPAFIDGNANITGPLYFWRKTNTTATSTSYATLTKTAYVANGSAGGDTGTGFFQTLLDNPSGNPADWVINVGQGFIVKATGSTINFTNSMRRSSNADQFFRNAQTTTSVNNGLYWLNLTDNTGVYSQMAVGYSSEGTVGFDRGIDGENINKEFYLTSLIGADEYSIQGRPDFDSSDVVPLSYKAMTSGNYTISIDHTAGAFTDVTQAIYLKDNLTNTLNNLNTAGYSFTTDAGTFNNRFEIVYQTQLSNPTFTANTVVIYNQNNEFVINSGNSIMASVKVFDIRGRLIEEKTAINANQTAIKGGLSNQVLLVQITSEDGVVVTKKVVR